MRITVDLGNIASGARLHELIAPHMHDVRWIEMTQRDASAISCYLGVEVKFGTPDAALFGHPVVWVDDETPAPIPRGDQGGGASAPGEGRDHEYLEQSQ